MARLCAFFALAACGALAADSGYLAGIENWRAERETRLKADDGWLTVSGLFWLKEGRNPFGSDPKNALVLPAGAPAQAGVFRLERGKVTVDMDGAQRELRPNREEDKVTLGSLSLFLIVRGDRYGIRMRDRNSRFRREFHGLTWYPARESYRLEAKWEPHPAGRTLSVPNVLGQVEKQPSPGVANFRWNGTDLSLEPVLEGDQLFFIFKDRTAGKGTYGAGRFLYADLPKDGRVVLDFNKAYSPPCAFTPFATCPLPPKQNQLPVAIEAGERYTGDH